MIRLKWTWWRRVSPWGAEFPHWLSYFTVASASSIVVSFFFSFLFLLIPLFLLKAWCATASSSRDSASISSRPNLKVRVHKQSCVVPTANPVLTGIGNSGSYRWSCRVLCPPAFIRIFSVINTYNRLRYLLCGVFCVWTGGPEDNVLWIAMAGTHQIWALFLADGKLPRGRWETAAAASKNISKYVQTQKK